jgi:hypothetical protein
LSDLEGSKKDHLTAFLIGRRHRPWDRSGSEWLALGINEQKAPWREPGLLRVSKQVRADAQATYYAQNSFCALVQEDILQAVQSIVRVCSSSGVHALMDIEVMVLTTMGIADIAVFFPIARFIFKHAPLARRASRGWAPPYPPPIGLSWAPRYEEEHSWSAVFCVAPYEDIKPDFYALIRVAVHAKKSKMTCAKFRMCFRELVVERVMLRRPRRDRVNVAMLVEEEMAAAEA